ncbi:hypothetical protein CKY28_11000 [Sphingomonas lenta]|uniref:Uncharacterized protein n=1 Tax=Sphingomonas lenta TaxID=1141887 RepID=A0A2A2SFR9_9SPHN|nr:hypothetical protein CKY28_11000 [Sphingomonas lenta]
MTVTAESPLRAFVERMRTERTKALATAATAERGTDVAAAERVADTSRLVDKELKQLLKATSSNVAEAAYRVAGDDGKGGVLGLLKA